jgi:hypothetical protein
MACPLLLASRLGKSQKRWHSVLKVLFQNKLSLVGFILNPPSADRVDLLFCNANGISRSNRYWIPISECILAFAFVGNCSTNPPAVGGRTCSQSLTGSDHSLPGGWICSTWFTTTVFDSDVITVLQMLFQYFTCPHSELVLLLFLKQCLCLRWFVVTVSLVGNVTAILVVRGVHRMCVAMFHV